MAAPLLNRVLSQDTAVQSLRRALTNDRVHHAYLFDGPDGVGKELAAFGLAQALVCEKRVPGPGGGDAACGECSACVRAIPRSDVQRPLHPDVVVLERGLYEPGQIGRRSPETQDLSIDQVRTLVLSRVQYAPHEGRAQIFVVRRADEMSISAANALLKTLEEPPKRTHFVLLTAQPDVLLPTIRSRTQRVRFAPLPYETVSRLMRELGTEITPEIARLSAGSVAAALALSDPEESARREQFVARAVAALEAPTMRAGLALAEDSKKGQKDVLARNLVALADALAARAREAAGASDRAADVASARHRLALVAAQDLDANASPQLTVESMLLRMRAL